MFERYRKQKKYKIDNLYIAPVRELKGFKGNWLEGITVVTDVLELAIFRYAGEDKVEHIAKNIILPAPNDVDDIYEFNKQTVFVYGKELVKFRDFFYKSMSKNPELFELKKLSVPAIKLMCEKLDTILIKESKKEKDETEKTAE